MATPGGSMETASLQVVVISPENTVFEGVAESVVVPGWDGEIGILRGHAPLMTILGSGDVRITAGGSEHKYPVEGGFAQVFDNVVTVLSESPTSET